MPQLTLSKYRAALFMVAALLATCTGPSSAPSAGTLLPDHRNGQSGSAPNDSSGRAWHVTKLLKALQPFGITVKSTGDVYFTELPSSSAKVLLTDGKIESIVAQLRRADGIAVYKNITYIADTTHRLVKRVSGSGKVSTIGSGWHSPVSVTTDLEGDLYVYDNGLGNIFHFRHDQELGSISIATSCSGVTNGLGLDKQQNLYVACYSDNQVLRIQQDGTAMAICSGWQSPYGITSDPSGNVYVTNNSGATIYECTSGGQLKTIVPDQKIGRAVGLSFHDSDLYVTATDKREIYKLSPP